MGRRCATVPQRSTDDTIIGLIDAAKEDGAGYCDVALPHLPFLTTARRAYAIGSLPKGRFEQRASTRCGKWPLQVDFDSAARVYGEQVLRERCGSDRCTGRGGDRAVAGKLSAAQVAFRPGPDVPCCIHENARKRPMTWTTPTLVEICIGLEINGYLPAEF